MCCYPECLTSCRKPGYPFACCHSFHHSQRYSTDTYKDSPFHSNLYYYIQLMKIIRILGLQWCSQVTCRECVWKLTSGMTVLLSKRKVSFVSYHTVTLPTSQTQTWKDHLLQLFLRIMMVCIIVFIEGKCTYLIDLSSVITVGFEQEEYTCSGSGSETCDVCISFLTSTLLDRTTFLYLSVITISETTESE